MDLDKGEAIPGPDLADLPQERHIWRMEELPPHSSIPVPTTFGIDSEPEPIKCNLLKVEPLPIGSHRNISTPVKNWYREAKDKQ
ncbi:hypothetical protein O181_049888 [Austropuccinia psidii MF-1]|uniref:Uncharacterized protein n=1 Tax=Austropuccinia psidii MF-1 TaxID=1389203 RepID=A0A9Q3HLV7_9BASI|nr:hypothetical protein [Austropuccinia psidii MF-1]